MEKMETCACGQMTEEEKISFIDNVMHEYDYKEANLIQILHMAQGVYGFLPIEIQKHIAKAMDLPLSKVSGVISFYSLFTTEKKGDYVIKVCLGTACYVRGGQKIIKRLNQMIGIDVGETSDDYKFTLEVTRCIGACGLAPAMMINDEIYTGVNPDKLPDILNALEQ